ncbi:uncharacterized protein [Oscarella lobularis]|uniref:uncharacterized protein isoform X2 n=1 Tax=Oscarella lobularis TaxID=121494 RepID=UPI003313F085
MADLAQLWPFNPEKITNITSLSGETLAEVCEMHIGWVHALPPVLSEAYRIDVAIETSKISTRINVVNLIKILHAEAVRRDDVEKAQVAIAVNKGERAEGARYQNIKLLTQHAQEYVDKHLFALPEDDRQAHDLTAQPPKDCVCRYKEKCQWYSDWKKRKASDWKSKAASSYSSSYSSRCPSGLPEESAHRSCEVIEGTPCDFVLPLSNCLKGLDPVVVGDVKMYLIRRFSCTRDLLFMPQVIHHTYGQDPILRHDLHNNVQFVQHAGAWNGLLTMLQKIQSYLVGTDGFTTSSQLHHIVESVSFNFGKWESGISRNPGATNCHAHAHILLTRKAALALGKKNEEFIGYVGLPERDSHVLDIHQLSDYTSNLSLSDLKIEIAEVKTKRFDGLTQLIKSLLPGEKPQPPQSKQ